jgi:hypothetical protein
MNAKRKIKAKEIISDIRTGMAASELLAKYQFNAKSLRTIFQKLLQARAMSKDELNMHKSLHDGATHGLRRFRRKSMVFPLKIYDGGDPFKSGTVKDVSEKGVCIEGIDTAIGDVKNFIVRFGAFGDSSTMVFEGKCRWVDKHPMTGRVSSAGFEITYISSLDSGELKKLID